MPPSDLALRYLALPVDARYRISRSVRTAVLFDAFGNEDLETRLALAQTMSERFAATLLEAPDHTPAPRSPHREACEVIDLLVEGLSVRCCSPDRE